jgi:hypothetical protein
VNDDGPRWRIIPYAVVDGEASLRPSFLRGLQERMRAEGLERWLMFDTKKPSQLEIIAADPCVSLFSVVIDTPSKGFSKTAALFWLTPGPGNASSIHFCIFRKYWGIQARGIGRHVLATLLTMTGPDGKQLFPVIMAIPPEFNTHAVRYARDIGMTVVGIVPNVFYDAYEMRQSGAVMIYMTAAGLCEPDPAGG